MISVQAESSESAGAGVAGPGLTPGAGVRPEQGRVKENARQGEGARAQRGTSGGPGGWSSGVAPRFQGRVMPGDTLVYQSPPQTTMAITITMISRTTARTPISISFFCNKNRNKQ